MRVKIFEAIYFYELEKQINDFFRENEVEVVDIKYSTYVQLNNAYYTCMIIYK